MKKLINVLAAASFTAACFPLVASANIINGSFEADNWSGLALNLDAAGLTGWTVTDPLGSVGYGATYPFGVDNDSGVGPTPYGDQFVVLGPQGLGGNSIEQVLTGLTLGQVYTLGWAAASESSPIATFPGQAHLQVSVTSGIGSWSLNVDPPSSVNNYWDTWTEYSLDFTAGATSATISFLDLGALGGPVAETDIGLDQVTLQSVPEPGSLMALGSAFLLIGNRLSKRSGVN